MHKCVHVYIDTDMHRKNAKRQTERELFLSFISNYKICCLWSLSGSAIAIALANPPPRPPRPNYPDHYHSLTNHHTSQPAHNHSSLDHPWPRCSVHQLSYSALFSHEQWYMTETISSALLQFSSAVAKYSFCTSTRLQFVSRIIYYRRDLRNLFITKSKRYLKKKIYMSKVVQKVNLGNQ